VSFLLGTTTLKNITLPALPTKKAARAMLEDITAGKHTLIQLTSKVTTLMTTSTTIIITATQMLQSQVPLLQILQQI
jgi:hypothetical protein